MKDYVVSVTIEADIQTNTVKVGGGVKPEAREEVLAAFLQDQQGRGTDDRPAANLKVFHIRIQLDVSDDSFQVFHDCGNMGLVVGIAMSALRQLGDSENRSELR